MMKTHVLTSQPIKWDADTQFQSMGSIVPIESLSLKRAARLGTGSFCCLDSRSNFYL